MSDFKTQADIWRALLEGRRVQHKTWQTEFYVKMVDGFVVEPDGREFTTAFCFPSDWHLIPEPPQVVEFQLNCKDVQHPSKALYLPESGPTIDQCEALRGKRWRVVCTEIKDGE